MQKCWKKQTSKRDKSTQDILCKERCLITCIPDWTVSTDSENCLGLRGKQRIGSHMCQVWAIQNIHTTSDGSSSVIVNGSSTQRVDEWRRAKSEGCDFWARAVPKISTAEVKLALRRSSHTSTDMWISVRGGTKDLEKGCSTRTQIVCKEMPVMWQLHRGMKLMSNTRTFWGKIGEI